MLSFHNLSIGRESELISLGSSSAFELKPGLHLLIAPNGFGKTTFLQTLAGLVSVRAGEVHWNGNAITSGTVKYFSEYLSFPKWIRPKEWVPVFVGAQVTEPGWIEKFRMNSLWSRFLGEMSQGERRKVIWLAALNAREPVLLLDEPTRGLDFPALGVVREALEDLKSRGKTIILTSHDVGPIQPLATEIWFLHDKKLKNFKDLKGSRSNSYQDLLDTALELYL